MFHCAHTRIAYSEFLQKESCTVVTRVGCAKFLSRLQSSLLFNLKSRGGTQRGTTLGQLGGLRPAEVGSHARHRFRPRLIRRVDDNVSNLDVRRPSGGVNHVVRDVLGVQWLDVLSRVSSRIALLKFEEARAK